MPDVAPPRVINAAGETLIKSFEGCCLTARPDVGGIPTIGYGHCGPDVVNGMVWTQQQADGALASDLEKACGSIQRLVKVPLNENQFAALVSFTFNVGPGNLQRSTLLTLLNRGFYEQIPAQLMRWNRVNGEILGGLSRRRAAEGQLWNTPV